MIVLGEEARLKRLHTEWFHLWDLLEKENQGWEQVCGCLGLRMATEG